MSLIQREPSPAQSMASQANGKRSAGPRSPQGRAIAARNLLKPRLFSEVVERSMEALGESPASFERTHQALAAAMEPRDGWEAAWVQDIAILRWRLERLQRAEAAVAALRRRRLRYERQRSAHQPTGPDALAMNNLARLWGFVGIPDSVMKFEQVISILTLLRDILRTELFDGDVSLYFTLLYGKDPGPRARGLKGRFEDLKKRYAKGDRDAAGEPRMALIADLEREIAEFQELQALYTTEHLEADTVREDAELLPPGQELDEIIRYETHLEAQIERKLRQFYARRREPVLRCADSLPETTGEREARAAACQ